MSRDAILLFDQEQLLPGKTAGNLEPNPEPHSTTSDDEDIKARVGHESEVLSALFFRYGPSTEVATLALLPSEMVAIGSSVGRVGDYEIIVLSRTDSIINSSAAMWV
jgi:hypothetical protein